MPKGISSDKLYAEMSINDCILAPSLEFATKKLTENIASNSVILVLGAGDIANLTPKINKILSEKK